MNSFVLLGEIGGFQIALLLECRALRFEFVALRGKDVADRGAESENVASPKAMARQCSAGNVRMCC